MKELIIATNNAHKLGEFRAMLPDVKVLSLKDVGFHADIPETGHTFHENSAIKARTVFEKTGKPVLADDSGLAVEALDGAPGVYSARYAGDKATDADNVALLLKNMQGRSNRHAAFVCVLSYLDAHGLKQFEGKAKGSLLESVAGTGGFGYDPIFVPEGFQNSFAQMPPEEKNKISHRQHALQHFLAWYQG